MSYEPTQPMTPPSTSLTDPGGEDPAREGRDDPAQDDPAPDDTVEVAAPKGDSGQVTAPEGGLSQATIPRAVLSRASVPVPPSDAATLGNAASPGNAAAAEPQDATPPAVSAEAALNAPTVVAPAVTARADTPKSGAAQPVTAQAAPPRNAPAPAFTPKAALPPEAVAPAVTPQAAPPPDAVAPQAAAAEVAAPRDDTAKARQRQDTEATGDWASEYAAAWGQGKAPSSNTPPVDRVQDNAPQGDLSQDDGPRGGWAPANNPQGDWAQRNDPQGDWNRGNDPQGDWNRGNDPQAYGPRGYGPGDDWNRGNAPEGYGPQDYGPQDEPPVRPRRRRRPVRRSVISLFILLVIAIVLVIANFVGQAIAENDMASQFTANGFPVRPSVDIEGFPFLTQVAQKDFKKVVVSASNIPAGPVTISSLNATITGMHLNSSWNGATIDHLTATAFVSLSSLTDGISSELGDAASLTAVPDGPNKLKVTGTVLGLSASGVVEIKQTGPQQITIELPTSGGLVGTLLGSAPSFPINLPAGVPPSLRITGLTLNGQGLTLSAAATDATFSK